MALDLSTLSAEEAITAVYIGYYDRAPDPDGLAFWVNAFNGGLSLMEIAQDFSGQAETLDTYSFFSAPSADAANAFITELYLNLFNRAPDQEGLEFWSGQLQSSIAGADGALPVGEIILQIIGGAQNTNEGADLTTIQNKIVVGLDWVETAAAAGLDYERNSPEEASATGAISGVTSTQASVDAALAETDSFFNVTAGTDGDTFFLNSGTNFFGQLEVVQGGAENDTFVAEDGTLQSGDRIIGGGGNDVLEVFTENQFTAVSPVTTSVETVVWTNQTNDLNSQADNNVGGYSNGNSVEVDVELDAGRMNGVTRWENYDSRADLVIEDARDADDTDGTFTDDITVAMVSTDPGNVDYAIYFDDPTNTSVSQSTLVVQVIDQENAQTFSATGVAPTTTGVLTESRLESFSFTVNGTEVTIELPDSADVFGPTATYQSLTNAIQAALNTDAELAALGETLTATLSDTTFDEAASLDNTGTGSIVFGLQIEITSSTGAILVATNTDSSAVDPDTDIAARVTSDTVENTQLIALNVEFDDVGKGSMGGDFLAGAMSVGTQNGDDRTSDSIGIQEFNIEVDRSSQLQTINSTNNSLEVVNIVNGNNSGPNNTTTASDEASGDLVVRGQANPGAGIATDGAMPGAVPQHNSYGFSDVRSINASQMLGAVDLTAELTEEIVEKYLDIQDDLADGEADDVNFIYAMGTNDDEFFLNLDSTAVDAAGTGSREDFNVSVTGGAGSDILVTNVGLSTKAIDEQGQDFYTMNSVGASNGGWYLNSVSNVASEFDVSGGAGNDVIWTHGWGDVSISDGSGNDVIWTDNSGVQQIGATGFLTTVLNVDRTLSDDANQTDYVTGAAWLFNGEGTAGGFSGATNQNIILASAPTGVTQVSNGQATVTVSFTTAGLATGNVATDGVYTATAIIPTSELSLAAGNVIVDEQAYNQAIKQAINNDPVLSAVLEAVDGPGNSLGVYSKIDGQFIGTELGVSFTALVVNGSGNLIGTPVTAAGYQQGVDVEFFNFGGTSFAESDNTINLAADSGNDVVVLSTNDGNGQGFPGVDNSLDDPNVDLNGASNETIVIADGNFGTDTYMNFDAANGNATVDGAEDVIDFQAINYALGTSIFSNGALAANDDSISIVALNTSVNDTAALVATSYNSMATTGNAEAIAIIYNEANDNTGSVYLVTDTTSGDATASLLGEIELIGTDWGLLTAENFA